MNSTLLGNRTTTSVTSYAWNSTTVLTSLTTTSIQTTTKTTTGTSTSITSIASLTQKQTTSMQNGNFQLQVQEVTYPDVPLDANMNLALQTGQFVNKNLANLGVSIPLVIFIVVVMFLSIYMIGQCIFRARVSQQVKKFTKVSDQATPVATVATSVSVRMDSPGSPTSRFATNTATTSNTQTIGRQQVDFEGAGIGFENQEVQPDENATDYAPVDAEAADQNATTNAPVFALPGFLKLEFENDLRLKGKIAEGGGGIVYKADMLNEEFIARFGVDQVVVKVLKPMSHMTFNDLRDIVYQEIIVMQALSHHPNSITLVGFTDEPLSIVTKLYDRNMFSLVMSLPEYADNQSEFESLKSFVRTDSKLKKGLIVKGFEMLPEISLHLAWGVAAGMNEMHTLGILHRDLKSANVLLEYKAGALSGQQVKQPWQADPALAAIVAKMSGSFEQNSLAGGVGWGTDSQNRPFCPVNPVVCDFGLAKRIKKGPESGEVQGAMDVSAAGISYRYAAPEAFDRMQKGGSHTEEAKPVDVYAFSIIAWELLERRVPFHKMENKEIEQRVRRGERPAIQSQYRTDPSQPFEGNKHYTTLVKLIDKTWHHNPKERPSFFEIKTKLKPFWLGYRDPKEFPQSGLTTTRFATTTDSNTRLATTQTRYRGDT